MQIITTCVIKGGTGKTTTAAALLQAATKSGKHCLAIDLDAQANLTFFLGANQNLPGAYHVLHGQPVQEVIQATPQGIDVIAGAPDLAAETTGRASGRRLKEALQPIKENYDFIVIDTPPTMCDMTFNALQAATGLIIPLEADNSSLQGLYKITDIAHQITKTNPDLTIKGTVITRYDARPKLNRYLLDVIRDTGAEIGAPLLIAIRAAVAVKEAQAMQLSLFEYAPKCKAAADYMQLYEKIAE